MARRANVSFNRKVSLSEKASDGIPVENASGLGDMQENGRENKVFG